MVGNKSGKIIFLLYLGSFSVSIHHIRFRIIHSGPTDSVSKLLSKKGNTVQVYSMAESEPAIGSTYFGAVAGAKFVLRLRLLHRYF